MGRPRSNPDSEVMQAIDSGEVDVDGSKVIVLKGITRAERGSDIVRLYPTLWEPLKIHYRVEQATAAPGELRGA